MEVHLSHIAFGTSPHRLKAELANILHAPPFLSPAAVPFNFEASLLPQKRRGGWRIAVLTLPTVELAQQLLFWYGSRPPQPPRRFLWLGTIVVHFEKSRREARTEVLERIRRLPYEDPWEAQAREQEAAQLQALLVNVSAIQFGWECLDNVYSVEWEKACAGHLRFDRDRREFIVKVPGGGLSDSRLMAIRVNQIAWVSASVHEPSGRSVLFFSLSHPPSFETESAFTQLGSTLGQSSNSAPQRQRWSAFDEDHEAVAPFTSLAIRLECASLSDLQTFRGFAGAAHISVLSYSYPVERRQLFSEDSRSRYDLWAKGLPWIVAFHLEALLRSWLVDMTEILTLRQSIDRVLRQHKRDYTAALLRDFAAQAKALYWYGPDQASPSNAAKNQPSYTAHTALELFLQVLDRFVYKPLDTSLTIGDTTAPFYCHHLIVTPSTMILEGPYPERSNRIMRTYHRNQDCFLRVSFQDENRLQFRFDRDLDGRSFIDRRVKRVLLDGITIAGAHFSFLAYSQSALKEHSVWFVKPFRHVDASGNTHIVDAAYIIGSLGNFRNLSYDPRLIYCPARYAARISQAFTATDESISMEVGQIIAARDIKDANGKYAFTDGVGSISPQLAQEIWKALRQRRRRGRQDRTYPRAYQIRFQGSKGMLSVDYNLSGRAILLRPSMIKFDAPHSLTVEIARAFDKPGTYYLNRPLIMLLEGLGVRYEVFQELQDYAVRDAKRSVESLEWSARLLETHGLGTSFRLMSAMLGLHKLGLEPLKRDVFWRQMMAFAVNHVLRELKHRARIPVPGLDSWTLVGVADVHGYLGEGEVFVCVDSPNEAELVYLEGPILVSRSPTIHPGDVQVVHAIGKPPSGSPFARESLRNTIVFSIRGERPLPSCLGGGDLDGDVYNVTTRSGLLPKKTFYPADYEPAPKKFVDHESTMEDVAEFVAEYINSDTLGIIAITWLIIADQSPLGILDPDCLELASLHSDAVDYPKSGQPVPLEHIPRLRFKVKPDWNAPETISKENTSYYPSTRAIGKLFRAIDLPAVQVVERAANFQRRHMPGTDHESQLAEVLDQMYADDEAEDDEAMAAVRDRVGEFVETSDYNDTTIAEIWELYNTYVSQLRAICADHTLSHSRSAMLTEEEAVGTIVAKCSQPRKRKDLMSELREQTGALVGNVKGEIAGDDSVSSDESLRRAWTAYRLATLEGDIFGARSFSWIALGSIFDAIKEIEEEERTVSRRAATQ
ncbi:RdRP-domain-containing protein [Lentinus tigrinus ALCF2SS1-7]|uniref:RdRP-domain-containing protein n=1 Tax=Lentinus tigrinus ALCF2SS1-7 TaxID=1328758 RepID=UPI001166375B|nr:RdRP-domain-containing protein [Lentinus tigrinus ALCF2SS1-7]